MAEAFTITKEHRKIFYRTSRMAIYSLLVTLAACLVFFGINPFQFWDTPVHIVIVMAVWTVAYHVLEAVKKR